MPSALIDGCLLALLAVSSAHAQAPLTPPPAALPAPLPAPVASPAEVSDAEVAAEMANGAGPKLDLYGFADVYYQRLLMPQSNPWRSVFVSQPHFGVGSLNLYLDSQFAARWRSLVEVRFTYLPHGDETIAADGNVNIVNNTVKDPAEFGHEVRWGGIMIERAWLEYELHPLATLRVGQFLTPYGIWNVDHGAPVVIGLGRPFIVRDRLFPERQTGLELHGGTTAGEYRFGWHLTLSNGRGPAAEYKDHDDNKAVGGRLFGSWRGLVEATVGASAYFGKYTSIKGRFVPRPDGEGTLHRVDSLKVQYDELSLAADARVWAGQLLVQSEAMIQQTAYREDARRIVDATRLAPDGQRWGAYLLTGYRTRWFGLMPYVTGEFYKLANPGELTPIVGDVGSLLALYGGINVRPVPNVVLKLEFVNSTFPAAKKGSWGEHDLRVLNAQIAWAF